MVHTRWSSLRCGQDSPAHADIGLAYGVDIGPACSLYAFKQNMGLLALFVDNFIH